MIQKRKRRRQLPPFLRLPYRWDIALLQENCSKLMNTEWSGVHSEYESLCESYHEISKSFPLQDNLYTQLALTQYNNAGGKDLDISQLRRFEKRKNIKILDERNYTKKTDYFDDYWGSVISSFKGRVTRVRLAKMKAHSKIAPHIDYDTDYSIRVHIPIFTNEQVHFYIKHPSACEFESIHMPADGGAWFLNQGLEHTVVNDGSFDRVHLILSIDGQEDIEGYHVS